MFVISRYTDQQNVCDQPLPPRKAVLPEQAVSRDAHQGRFYLGEYCACHCPDRHQAWHQAWKHREPGWLSVDAQVNIIPFPAGQA